MSLAQTLRTLKYVHARQIRARLWYRARLPWFTTPLYSWLKLGRGSETPPLNLVPALWPGHLENAQLIMRGSIRLIGQDHPLEDWQAPEKSHLWRFTLHYFEWLADLAVLNTSEAKTTARALITSWMDNHRRPDKLTWHPYPLSLRLHAWLAHSPFILDGADDDFRKKFARSLHRQAKHLNNTPERDVGGNHLFKNLKTLAECALCLPDAGLDLDVIRRHIEAQISLQVLPDGGHYERSPSYHLQVFCDVLDLQATLRNAKHHWPKVDDAARRMALALSVLRHGDGGTALFNDGTTGDIDLIEAIAAHIKGLPRIDSGILPHSGYYRIKAGDSLIIADAGPVCPDELPGHAHADTLSFEFSRGVQRIVVNCGTYAYQDPVWRNRLRGTAAHSTVTVDNLNSAEVYGAFRVGHRPREINARQILNGIEASHDGYANMGIIHHRKLQFDVVNQTLHGADCLRGDGLKSTTSSRQMAARFHLHPNIEATLSHGRVHLKLPSGERWVFLADGASIHLEESVYAPQFYEMHNTQAIVVERSASTSGDGFSWRFMPAA